MAVRRTVPWLAVMLLVGATAAGAAAEGRVPLPVLPKAKGERCVEPPEVMRREHMVFLEHQRDDTVQRGIRGAKYSLAQCVDCHAVAEPAGGPERTALPFCTACHGYAAVTIDCFSCHTPKATLSTQIGAHLAGAKDVP